MNTNATHPVHVIECRPISGAGNLKAMATVQIGTSIVIRGVRVVQQPGQRAWVSMPAQKNGEKWFTVVEITKPALKEAISTAVLAAWGGSGAGA